MTSKNPCTISKALQHYDKEERRSKKSSDDDEVFTSECATDIMAIVTGLATRKRQNVYREVWIADHTIHNSSTTETNVLVSFFGQKFIHDIAARNLAIGDIVRFNRVSLKRKMVKKSEQKETTTFEFHHSWKHTEAGVEWFQLLRSGETTNDISTLISTRIKNCVIPENMETDPDRIRELFHWYRTSTYFQKQQDKNCLDPLPCQRRSLGQVQSSVGVISNVRAYVIGLEKIQEKDSAPSLKKRKRRSSSGSVTLASISDGRHSQMPFLDVENRFQNTLQMALDSNKPVLMNEVVTKKGCEVSCWLDGQQQWDDEPVLVPTPTTTIVLSVGNAMKSHSQDQTQPFLTDTQTQGYMHQHSMQKSNEKSIFEINASLQDVIMDDLGCSLVENQRYLQSPELLMTILIQKGNIYRGATLKLREDERTGGGPLCIKAGPQGMQQICADLGPTELKRKPAFQKHIAELLQGFLEEKVMLRWTLHKDTQDGEFWLSRVALIDF